MTAIELFNLITSEPKWYAGYTSPQHANLLKKRFHAKTLEFGTLEKLFNHYGYYLNAKWEKKPKVEFNYDVINGDPDKIAFIK